METNQSTPEPKKDEDVTILALLQKMSARLDGLERQISSSPIMSSSDGQAPVQMVLTHHRIIQAPAGFEKLPIRVDCSERPV